MSENTVQEINEGAVVGYFMGLSEEDQARIGDIETPDGYKSALEMYRKSLGLTSEKVSKPRQAKEQTVLLFVRFPDGSVRARSLGSALGSVGRDAADPSEWSDLKRLKNKAKVQGAKIQRAKNGGMELDGTHYPEGCEAFVLSLPSEELEGFF